MQYETLILVIWVKKAFMFTWQLWRGSLSTKNNLAVFHGKEFGNHCPSALVRRRSISNGGDAVPNVVGSERASACGNALNRRPGFA